MNATEIDTGFGVSTRFGAKEDAPLLFEHGGKFYATNLFKLHDTHGFPLANSLIECRVRGWHPCTQQFVSDAIRAGWPKDRAERVLRESLADSESCPAQTQPTAQANPTQIPHLTDPKQTP